MEEQKIFGITLFCWMEWNEIETGFLQFYNVEFPFASMKKYDGMDVSLDMNGEITITNESGEEIWKGFAVQIPEFFDQVCAKSEW